MVANLAEINYSSEKSFIFPRSFSKHKDQREINFSQTNYVGSDNIDYLDLLLKYMPENNTGKPFYVYSYDIEAFSYHYRHYTSRISELNELAEEEDIHPIKDESKKDFFEFLKQLPFPVRKGNLALSDDGILSITWLNKQWRLSLNFLGNEQVEYVLLDLEHIMKGKVGESKLRNLCIEESKFDIEGFLAE